ncbi:MAG: hypothetical protein EOO09_19100 [Chitinophagaceae bacterium]|nr:MAG: hypothetical protein EOO09_19100 [Chitinophagaceae bacterium]
MKAPDARTVSYGILLGLTGSVWLINGLFCKLMMMVPRHMWIVGSVLGYEHAVLFTKIIGLAETLFAFWIVSGYLPRVTAILQVIVILAMNLLEFFLAPGLLLWGRFNLVFALLFAAAILVNEFVLRPSTPNGTDV